MKTRILVYGVLVVLVAAVATYMVVEKPSTTGRATGTYSGGSTRSYSITSPDDGSYSKSSPTDGTYEQKRLDLSLIDPGIKVRYRKIHLKYRDPVGGPRMVVPINYADFPIIPIGRIKVTALWQKPSELKLAIRRTNNDVTNQEVTSITGRRPLVLEYDITEEYPTQWEATYEQVPVRWLGGKKIGITGGILIIEYPRSLGDMGPAETDVFLHVVQTIRRTEDILTFVRIINFGTEDIEDGSHIEVLVRGIGLANNPHTTEDIEAKRVYGLQKGLLNAKCLTFSVPLDSYNKYSAIEFSASAYNEYGDLLESPKEGGDLSNNADCLEGR